jgi:DNA-binding response OmpR family regulator
MTFSVATAPTVNSSSESVSSKKRVLIVEDDPDLLHLLRESLEVYGFEVDAYSQASDAVKSFFEPNAFYNLILMDLKLGGMDGRTVYKKFKERDSKFKICILTGLEVDTTAFREICPSFEDKFLINKPVKISSLVQTLNSVLESP